MLEINNSFLLLKLPFLFLYWWFFEAPLQLLKFLVKYFFHLTQQLSLPILFKTFFSPWKSENRKDFIWIARGVGIVVRTFVISADLIILSLFLLMEIVFFFLWLAFPIVSFYLLYFSLIQP